MRRVWLVLFLMIVAIVPQLPAFAASGSLRVASTSDEGVKGDDESTNPAMPVDGSKVAFHSAASNLDPADPDSLLDEYVKDLATGEITLISTSDTGAKSNGNSWFPAFSPDGTTVAFRSDATNLDPGDTDVGWDIFVKNLVTGDITLGSTSDTGEKSNGSAFNPFLSWDGTILAFRSSATNLDPGDTDKKWDAYVKDLTTGDITLASTSDSGVKGNGTSGNPALTGDGRLVAFYSGATNLDPADTDATSDIYIKDLTTGDLSLVSTSGDGVKGNHDSILPSISPDGTTLLFSSRASNLHPADTDNVQDIFIKDLTTGEITLVSSSGTGEKGNAKSRNAYLSADGSKVGFVSEATNLHPGDTDSVEDVYLKDLTTGQLLLISTSETGEKSNAASLNPALSANGQRVAFHSAATNLDPADEDAILDVYVKDLEAADLGLAISDSPDPVDQGDVLTYTITVSNDGPSPATGVVLEATLPAKTDFISAVPSQGTCSRFDRTVTCDLSGLPVEASATVIIDVRPRRPGRITMPAMVVGSELDLRPGNNSRSEGTTIQRP